MSIMGIDISELVHVLAIKPDRLEALMNILKESMESQNNQSDVEDLQRIMAFTTKANEMAFLCFIRGLIAGNMSAGNQINQMMPRILTTAAEYGAKKALQGEFPPGMEVPPGTTTAAPVKKDNKPEDPMYG